MLFLFHQFSVIQDLVAQIGEKGLLVVTAIQHFLSVFPTEPGGFRPETVGGFQEPGKVGVEMAHIFREGVQPVREDSVYIFD